MSRTVGAALLLVMSGLILTACWDRREVNDIVIVTAIGVDAVEEGQVQLSVQLALPAQIGGSYSVGGSGRSKEDKPVFVATATARTVSDALRKMQTSLSRTVFWSHSRVLVVSEKLAREGLKEHFDFFARNQNSRLEAYILVTPGRAREILEARPELETIPAEAISKANKIGVMVATNLREFLIASSSPGGNPTAARVELIAVDPDPTGGKAGRREIKLTGAALFREDKLAGWMDIAETRGILWLTGKLKTGVVTFTDPVTQGEVSLEVIRANTQFRPRFEGEQIVMEVKILTEDDVDGAAPQLDLSDPREIHRLEKAYAKDVEERIKQTLAAARRLRTDVFGFGEAVHRAFPGEWKKLKERWNEEFLKVRTEISVEAKIRRTGMAGRSLWIKEKEVKKREAR